LGITSTRVAGHSLENTAASTSDTNKQVSAEQKYFLSNAAAVHTRFNARR
jgi:hypothetical protein